MAYREFPAPIALSGVIECGWTAWVPAEASPETHPVLPDGCMDLVWTGTQIIVAGPDTVAHPARRAPGVLSAGLRFAPGALPALLDVPAAELRDQRVPLADLHPAPARHALARLEHGTGAVDVLAELAAVLPGRPAEAGVRAAASYLDGGAAAADVADALGWTPRTLHRRCLAAFGYGPAVLRRVLRFRRAAALLHAGIAPATVAAGAGYADQPHLSREVRALAGMAPGQLAARP